MSCYPAGVSDSTTEPLSRQRSDPAGLPGGHLPLGRKETLKMAGAGLAWLLLGLPLVGFILFLLLS